MEKHPENSVGQVPTSSSKNRFATKRTLVVAAIVLAIVLLVMLAPW